MNRLLKNLPKPFFVLAPMDDVTDTVFRQVIATLPYASHASGVQGDNEKRASRTNSTANESRKQSTPQSAASISRVASSASKQAGAMRRYGPDLYITEFVNVDGLQSPGREKLLKKLQFTDKERPIVAQLWGKNPENFHKTAKELVKMGFDGVDLNFGCPDKAVIKNGCCIALCNNRELAGEIIQATKKGAGSLPVSVKTRLGLNEIDYSWIEFLLQQKLNMLTIHGRTARQMSKVPADWEAIGKVKRLARKISPSTLVVGNGDVKNKAEGLFLAKLYGLDGIMIGRGVFDDPFAFASPPAGRSPWAEYTPKQKIELYKKHVQLFAKTWKQNERKIYTLGKFCKIYINGFDGAKELREKLMAARNTDELLGLLNKAGQKL